MRSWLFGLVLLPVVAQAEIYRWTDTQGRVHFGSRAQAGADANLIVVQPQIIERDQATREREARVAEVFDARRLEQSQARENARERQAQRDQECRRLREHLARLERGGRFYYLDDEQQHRFYSDEQLTKARQQLRDRVAGLCA